MGSGDTVPTANSHRKRNGSAPEDLGRGPVVAVPRAREAPRADAGSSGEHTMPTAGLSSMTAGARLGLHSEAAGRPSSSSCRPATSGTHGRSRRPGPAVAKATSVEMTVAFPALADPSSLRCTVNGRRPYSGPTAADAGRGTGGQAASGTRRVLMDRDQWHPATSRISVEGRFRCRREPGP